MSFNDSSVGPADVLKPNFAMKYAHLDTCRRDYIGKYRSLFWGNDSQRVNNTQSNAI